MSCHNCSGTGGVLVNGQTKMCPYCHGMGKDWVERQQEARNKNTAPKNNSSTSLGDFIGGIFIIFILIAIFK